MQVPAALTPTTAADVIRAVQAAYRTIRGADAPRSESWAWAVAVSANETDHWSELYNWNAGNVARSWNVNGPWYVNPKVTGLSFASFDSLYLGALALLKTMKQNGALDAADAGDIGAWRAAMGRPVTGYAPGYATWDPRPLAANYAGPDVVPA